MSTEGLKDHENIAGDEQQQAFIRFSFEIRSAAVTLKQTVSQVRRRVGSENGNWQLFCILDNASEILEAISSATLNFTEEEHLNAVSSLLKTEEKGEELPPLTPRTQEWTEVFLSFMEGISSLAGDIQSSVARLEEMTDENEDVFEIVKSTACIMYNVSSSIESEIEGEIFAGAFADEEQAIGELFGVKNDLALDFSESTSRTSVKRGADSVSDDEPQQKLSKPPQIENSAEGANTANVGDNEVMPVTRKLSDRTLQLLMDPLSPRTVNGTLGNSSQQQMSDLRSSSSPLPSVVSVPSPSPPTTQQIGSSEGFDDLFTTQASAFCTEPDTSVTCTVQGHSISYISDRPIDLKMVANRLMIQYREPTSASDVRASNSPLRLHMGPDRVQVAMDGMQLTLVPKEGTLMDGVIVSLSGKRQLEILIPE